MLTLLHLSDLHLAPPGRDSDLGDYKADVIPPAQRQRRVLMLENSLSALSRYLDAQQTTLDAVVISGDVTLGGQPEGFALLPDLLGHLGDRLPPPKQVVVVPGNHDVTFRTSPGSKERYAAFVSGVRSRGYVTPLLEGVDYRGDQVSSEAPSPLLLRDQYLVAALNSADYSGCLEPLRQGVDEELDALRAKRLLSKELEAELDRLRLYDVARLNGLQLRVLTRMIRDADPDDKRVRVAVLHHHIGPVTALEEVKPFEAVTNLGEFRSFLADNLIDVVLHGHKHVGRVGEDVWLPYDTAGIEGPRQAHRCLVVSAGTIGASKLGGSELGKLISIDDSLPRIRTMRVQTVPGVMGGGSYGRHFPVQSFPTSRGRLQPNIVTIRGLTAAEVHEQIEELHADRSGRAQLSGTVVCIIDDGPSASIVPPTYPYRPPDDDRSGWFQQTVDWWQDDQYCKGKPFTHGQYIRGWQGRGDQLQSVVAALASDLTTSRAVITLLQAHPDLANKSVKFPAFCTVQFSSDSDALNALGVFRKQELRYWWAINAAEIARLQHEVVESLRLLGHHIRPGTITTVATRAVLSSDGIPKVEVPALDRLYWSDRRRLWMWALAVIDPSVPDRADAIAEMTLALVALTPSATMPPDGPPVSEQGLRELADTMASLAERYAADAELTNVVHRLQQLVDVSDQFTHGEPDASRYPRWRNRMRDVLAGLREELGQMSV